MRISNLSKKKDPGMKWVSIRCKGNYKAYRNYVTLKSLPFDSRIFSKELVKVKNDRQALVVHAVYKSRMTRFSMQENIAPRDRIHKSDGRQPLTDGRRSVILSAKRNLDGSLTTRTKISHDED